MDDATRKQLVSAWQLRKQDEIEHPYLRSAFRYQRAQMQDLGSKWKLFYWDYNRTPRQRRTKSWAKSRVPGQREAQRLGDQFMERVNERNNQPHLFASDEDTV